VSVSESEDLRLNQIGIAVWLLDRRGLDGIRLRETRDPGRTQHG
jgi:hypothetical protein